MLLALATPKLCDRFSFARASPFPLQKGGRPAVGAAPLPHPLREAEESSATPKLPGKCPHLLRSPRGDTLPVQPHARCHVQAG